MRKVLSFKQLPMRAPVWSSLTCWLVLDRLQAAGWVYGVVGCLMALVWIAFVHGLIKDQPTELRELS